MPGLTLSQLRTPVTETEALEQLLLYAQTMGFQTSSWQSGSVQRTILQTFARIYSTLTNTIADLTYLCFNDTSQDEALTVFADSHYDNQRLLSTATIGTERFTGGPVGPPHVIVAGQLVVVDSVFGITFRNTTGFVIPVSGFVDAPIQAEVAGAASAAVADGTVTILQTPLAGVTVNNPGPGWITTAGTDEETDDVLKLRNRAKWAVLNTITKPADWYIYSALSLTTAVNRVRVYDNNPGGPGTVWVYLAGPAGPVAASVVSLVDAYYQAHRPVTAIVVTNNTAAQPIAVTAEIWVTTTLHTAAKETEIETAIDAMINAVPIEGEVIPPGPTGYLLLSELMGAITVVEGVRAVTIALPAANVAVVAGSVCTPGIHTLTFTDID